ncbi:MAG: NrtA/SsuA/CpmA family ABC transporter substrate-binding protein [Magnetococcales bacterium]|nr:NrtA/SsuA/CpmA family ABC transporter substrate-binding protein [Magnetococcales bacterium]MBF0421279.1 NrtA/SsuA/CpmA family ABC transporter substrate-binding protein [Magnetococcales bacterium]
MTRQNYRWMGLAILVLVFATVAITAMRTNAFDFVPPTTPIKSIPLTIGADESDVSTLIWVAHDREYTARRGLAVTMKPFSAGKFAAEALERGDVDLAASADIVLIKRILQGTDLRVLASINFFNTNDVIARRDSGITRPSDLKGKRLGLVRGSSSEYDGSHFLLLNGLSLKDVTIVNLLPQMLEEAIVAGNVDAVSIWSRFADQIARRLGSNAVVFPHDASHGSFFLLLARENWLKDHSEAIQRMLAALNDAARLVEEDPESARRLISKRFGNDTAYFDHFWPRHNFRLNLPQSLLVNLEEQARWLLDSASRPEQEIPNVLSYIRSSYLKNIDPSLVTLIQ